MRYKLINGWTKAKAIETLRHHLPSDGSKAMDDSGKSCVYLTKRGYRCAAGAFLPIGVAERSSGTIGAVLLESPELAQLMPLYTNGMRDLQRTHDSAMPDESAVELCVAFIETQCYESEVAL